MTEQNLQKRITIRIDQDRALELEEVARQEGVTVSFMIRHLVIRFLEERKKMMVLKSC